MPRKSTVLAIVFSATCCSQLFSQNVCSPASSCQNSPPLLTPISAGEFPQLLPVAPLADNCNSTYPDFVLVKAAGNVAVGNYVSDALNTWMNEIGVPDPAGTCRDTRAGRFNWYYRDAARAAVFFSMLVNLTLPGNLSTSQAAALNHVAQELGIRRQQAALIAQSEYSKWLANACVYGAPAGFPPYNPGSGMCVNGANGPELARGAVPALPPFAAYGAATAFSLLNSRQGAAASREVVSLLIPALERTFLNGGFLPYQAVVPYARQLESAFGVMGSSLALGSSQTGQSLPPAGVAANALLSTLLKGVASATPQQLPAALQQAVTAAQAPVALNELLLPLTTAGGSQALIQEFFATFLEITLLDGPDPTLLVPAPATGAPSFQIATPTGVTSSTAVTALVMDPAYQQATPITFSMNRGWFAISKDGVSARLAYLIDYLDWTGNSSEAVLLNGLFYVTDPGNTNPVTSPTLYVRGINHEALRVTLSGASLPSSPAASTSFVMTTGAGQVYGDSMVTFVDWNGHLNSMRFDGTSLIVTPYVGSGQIRTTQIRYVNWDGTFWTGTLNPLTKVFLLSRSGSLAGSISSTLNFKGFDGGNWTFRMK